MATDTNILNMRESKLGIMVFVFSALLLSISAFGQGRGTGGGNGQGRTLQHSGRPGMKTQYENINTVRVFSSTGVEIYSATNSISPSKEKSGQKIVMVEINPKGYRIYFGSKKEENRVIDLNCSDCIILVDHINTLRGADD